MSDVNIKVKNVRHLNEQEKAKLKKEAQKGAYEQLKEQAKVVFNRVNKRIRNIENNKNIISPAYNVLKKKRGNAPRFGTSGSYHDLKSLQKEYAQALSFDNMETSTVQGSRAYTDNLKSQLSLDTLDKSAINVIFEALHSLHERMPDILYNNLLKYTDYLETIVENTENIDFNSISNYETKVETLVNNAIDELTEKMSDKLNEGIDILSGNFNRLF